MHEWIDVVDVGTGALPGAPVPGSKKESARMKASIDGKRSESALLIEAARMISETLDANSPHGVIDKIGGEIQGRMGDMSESVDMVAHAINELSASADSIADAIRDLAKAIREVKQS